MLFGCPAPLLEHRELGWGPYLLLPTMCFAGAPGPPGVPIIVRYSSAIAIHWSSGDPGKGPITRYVIEARPSGTRCPGLSVSLWSGFRVSRSPAGVPPPGSLVSS